MDAKVKNGENIELDGVTVINTGISLAEKEEEKETTDVSTENNAETAVTSSEEPVATTTTQPSPTTIESTISSLNPTIPNIPNIPNTQIPVPDVSVGIDPSLITPESSLPGFDPLNTQTYSNDTANLYNGGVINNSEEETPSSVFKDEESVDKAIKLYADKVSRYAIDLANEMFAVPTKTSVKTNNRLFTILPNVYMNSEEHEEVTKITNEYNGTPEYNADSNEEVNDTVGITYSSSNDNNDLSRMNIPRF